MKIRLQIAALLAAAVALSGPALASPGLDELGIGKDAQAAAERIFAGEVDAGYAELARLARTGRTDAAEMLAEFTAAGAGGRDPDQSAACKWFAISATDRADGRHSLAACYEHGLGRPIDLPLAARLYREAGEMGYDRAWCALGNLMLQGKGVAKDVPGGVALCTRGAEAGVADAQTDLGNIYLRGKVAPQDSARAAFWYEKAAAQNQANAAFTLGQMHWNGDGVAKDHARAAALWRIAYEGGRPDAPFLLAREALTRAMADKTTVGDAAALEEAIGWMELAAELDPDPKLRKMMVDGLPIIRANLELARRTKP